MWDGVDRRRFPRAEYPCLITLRKNTPPVQAILTHTENISVGGVRVIIPQKIETLTEVDLELDLKDTLPNVTARGAISRTQQVPAAAERKKPRYDTGIQFIALKDEYRRRFQYIIERLLGKSA